MPRFSIPAMVFRRESCLAVGQSRRHHGLAGISLTPLAWPLLAWTAGEAPEIPDRHQMPPGMIATAPGAIRDDTADRRAGLRRPAAGCQTVTTEGNIMITVILVIAIVLGAGWTVWRRRGRWGTPAASGTPAGMTSESLAFEAFTHGNTCLSAGKFAEATTAFQRSRELDPKRPHVAERLAEVTRRQHAANTTPSAGAAS
jgi:hypothetical protein